MSSMADALSSASLLLAALALIYNAWSGSIDAEINRTYAADPPRKCDEKKKTFCVLIRSAFPLAVGSWLIVLAFVPRDFHIVSAADACLKHGSYYDCYDDVTAVFALTQLFVAGMAVYLSGSVCVLCWKLTK